MDSFKLTIILLITSLSILWIISGIINYFVIKHYTNNKKVIWSFVCLGFLGSVAISFLGFTKLVDTVQIKDDLKKQFARSKTSEELEFDWIEENEQIDENGKKIIIKNYYYQDKLVKSETTYKNKHNNDN